MDLESHVGPSAYYDDDYAPPPTRPRVNGYTSTYEYDRRPDVVVRAPGRRGGCGEFFYWDGSACVDARNNPPDLRANSFCSRGCFGSGAVPHHGNIRSFLVLHALTW